MFRKRDKTSSSGRTMAKGRADLQQTVSTRLYYWRLFLEAKQLELEERRSAGGLVPPIEQPSSEVQDAPDSAVAVEEHLLETLRNEAPPPRKQQRRF